MNDVIVNKGTYLVYGNVGCYNCDVAKRILNEKNLPFVYKLFGQDYDLEELMELLPKPSRSMPQVFHVGEGNVLEYVGSLMELIKYLKS